MGLFGSKVVAIGDTVVVDTNFKVSFIESSCDKIENVENEIRQISKENPDELVRMDIFVEGNGKWEYYAQNGRILEDYEAAIKIASKNLGVPMFLLYKNQFDKYCCVTNEDTKKTFSYKTFSLQNAIEEAQIMATEKLEYEAMPFGVLLSKVFEEKARDLLSQKSLANTIFEEADIPFYITEDGEGPNINLKFVVEGTKQMGYQLVAFYDTREKEIFSVPYKGDVCDANAIKECFSEQNIYEDNVYDKIYKYWKEEQMLNIEYPVEKDPDYEYKSRLENPELYEEDYDDFNMDR